MAELVVADRSIALDTHGHLRHSSDWSPIVAEVLASQAEITLTPAHWEIIDFLRDFYATYGNIPIMRLLLKAMRNKLGADKADSIYLNRLFPGIFLRTACQLAGLPKPKHCL